MDVLGRLRNGHTFTYESGHVRPAKYKFKCRYESRFKPFDPE